MKDILVTCDSSGDRSQVWRYDMADFHLTIISSVYIIYCWCKIISQTRKLFSANALCLNLVWTFFIPTIVKRLPRILRGSKTTVLLRKKNYAELNCKCMLSLIKEKSYALGRSDLWSYSLAVTLESTRGGRGLLGRILSPKCT